MTTHEELGLSIVIYEPLARGGQRVKRFSTLQDYTHSLAANGGFDKMSFSISDDRLSLDEWLENGVGRHVEVYNQAADLVWEGFINKVSGTLGAQTVSVGALTEMANRVSALYTPIDYSTSPPTVGSETITTIAENLVSQARYGIIEAVITAGRMTDADAELVRDTYLQEMAHPASESQLAVGSSANTIITLECLGYWYWANLYVFNSTTTGSTQVDTRIEAIINGNPNAGMYGTPSIDTNNAIIPEQEENDKTAMTHIKELLALGGANDQRYTLGFYEHRQAQYRELPTEPYYKIRLSDSGQRIQTYQGALVYPWDVRPAQWLFISDALIGRYSDHNELYEDPRYLFIEQVDYTAPWQVNISGSRVGTFSQLMARYGLGDF